MAARAALLGIGTADTGLAALFGADQIADNGCRDRRQQDDHQNTFQHDFILSSSGLRAAQRILHLQLPFGMENQPHDHGRHHKHRNQPAECGNGIQSAAGDQRSDRVDQIRHGIPDAELETDPGPDPLPALHFGIHRADRRKAGGRIEIKHQIGERCDLRDRHNRRDFGARALDHLKLVKIDQVFKADKANRQRADDVLLRNEAGDCRRRELPRYHADDRYEQIGEGSRDRRQDRLIRRFRHAEAPIKGLHELNRHIAEQDDGRRLDDIGPAAAAHRFERAEEGGGLVFRKLDDKEGFSRLVARDLIDQQRTEEDQQDTGQVHHGADPARVVKEGSCKERDHGDLGAAGHKGREHGGGSPLPLVADGAARHNAGDGAADGDDKGNHRFAGQSDLLEDRVEDDGDAGHISAVLQQGDEEIHHHNKRQEAHHGDHASDHAVYQNGSQQRMRVLKKAADPALEALKPAAEQIRDRCADPNLRDLENQKHHDGKNRNTEPFVGQHRVDLVSDVSIPGQHLALFDLFDDAVDKLEAFSVCLLHRLFVGQIDLPLAIRRFLLSSGSPSRRLRDGG